MENAAQSEVVKNKQQVIPESLIYEMSKGKAIYYRGFQDYLRGEKVSVDEITE
ncbi:MAG TPA: hypothetical protein VJL89_06035 [Thermodesulfovibrionia bacterium]|nr:hypothetical protein [Thermodesulfovibrionia bacterium]